MAGSDDECDLDALSALLEEDSDEGLSAQDAAEKTQVVQENTQCFAENSMDTCPAEEEMDMETLASMLDQDSDLEDSCSQQEQQEVTADDIAAFFNETSDSENDGEAEDGDDSKEVNGQLQSGGGGFEPEVSGGVVKRSEPSQRGSPATHSGSDKDSDTQGADQHVKQLQDELATMQQRMVEIQQMLASQTSSTAAATVSPPATQPSTSPKPQTKQAGFSKTASTSSSSILMSSSPVLSKAPSSSRKVKSSSSSPALTQPGKKPSPVLLTSEKSKTAARTTDHTTNGSASSRLHSSSHKKSQSQRTAAGKPLNSAGQRTSTGTKKEQIHTTNNSQSKGIGEKTQRGGSHEQLDSAGQRISTGTKKEQIHTTNSSQSKAIGEKAERGDSHELSSKKKKPSSTFLADVAENRGDASCDRQSLKRSLFGDDDSNSDWEDGEGDKARLSSGGQEIQRLLVQGQRQRQAHTPSYSLPSATATWRSKAPTSTVADTTSVGSLHGPSTKAGVSTSVRKEPDTKDYTTEKFSGLRIINPKVSSVMLAAKMEGRRMIAVSRLHLKVNSPDLQGDWVTIGVIVHKSEARKSQTGKTYSLWKLSDLDDTERTVSFFLFGQVYKHLWKMDVGTVIGLLNPNVMDAMEKGGGDVAFTVNNAQQVMEIGRSKDLGCCVSKTKRGASCTNFVNKKLGDFCTYHVQAAYRRQSAKRGELHGSCPGTAPKSSLKNKILQNNTFFYGGECYTASQGRGRGRRDKVTLTKLQAVMTQQEQRKVNTLAIQNLMPDHTASVQSALTSQHQRPFLDMLSVPTAGSMNLVRHIAQAEGKLQDVKKAGRGEAPTFQSVNARDLLKQHREQIAERINSRKQQQKTSSQNGQQPQAKRSGPTRSESPEISHSKSSDQLHSKSTGQLRSKNSGQSNSRIPGQSHSKSTGQLHSKNSGQSDSRIPGQSHSKSTGQLHVKSSGQSNSRIPGQSHSKSTGQLHSKNSGIPGQSHSKSSRQLHVKSSEQSDSRIPGQLQGKTSELSETPSSDAGLHTPASSKRVEGSSDCAHPRRTSSGADAPKLGKGFYPGKKIDLFGESSASSQRKPTQNDVAMRKAIEKVRAMGGLEKTDPNATRPTTQNPDKVRKRVLENIENAHKVTEGGDGDRRSLSAAEPARKKSRLLGNVDPSSDEVKQLLNARSSHTGALAQAEAEREERYFDKLEQKEKMEEKMKSVTAMEVTVVTCEQCQYTAMSQSDRCKQERHTVRRHKGKRRFFACKKCKHRTVSLHRYPTSPCTKCGEHSYEKTSMHQEKTGPKLESEVLCLRGDESKFINAMDQKVFLSTVVQD